VRKAAPDAALVLVGEGPLQSELQQLSARLGLKTFFGAGAPPPDAAVYFTGFRENPYNFTAAARLFVFTSLWEGFPNALVEALACGAPVVSADCASGPREILAPGTAAAPRAAVPENAACGVLMPALSGRRLAAVPPEPEETVWARELVRLLGDKASLERYARAGAASAVDFSLSKAAALWKEILTT
jgi:glycosyltransferase involved in cell wall biosynthesis